MNHDRVVKAMASIIIISLGGPMAWAGPAEPTRDEPFYLQIVNPADTVREHSPNPQSPPATMPGQMPIPTESPHYRAFELPAVTVTGEAPPELREEERVGPNEQPRWTAERRFPGTRVYVQPPGIAQFEFWLRPTSPRHGKTEWRSLAELEIGLPDRFQIDLYARAESESSGPTQVGESVEIRYALADWNKIWGNPTLYIEWSRLQDTPDQIEAKLLLGGEIAPRWHWGVNLSDELTTGGTRENEIEITGGVSYSLKDSFFSLGAETECGVVDTQHHRGTYNDKFFFVGPSMQLLPTDRIHIDFCAAGRLVPRCPGISGLLRRGV